MIRFTRFAPKGSLLQLASETLRYLATHRGYAPSTLATLSKTLRAYVIPALGGLDVDTIARSDVYRMIGDISSTKSPATAQRALSALRVVCRTAISVQLIGHDPTAGIAVEIKRPPARAVIEPQLLARMLCRLNQQARVAYRLACDAGLRSREIIALRWDDLDLDGGSLTVRGPVKRTCWDGEREVTLSPLLKCELVRLRRQNPDAAHVFGDGTSAATAIRRVVSQARKDWAGVGYPALALYEGRRLAMNYMAAAGMSVMEIAYALGASPGSVLRGLDHGFTG